MMSHPQCFRAAVAPLILLLSSTLSAFEGSSSPVPMCLEASQQPAGQLACGLGASWNVVAGCWPGIYTRRGSSNIFDAQMTQVNGDRYAATVAVSVNGAQVTATQTDVGGGPCYLRNGSVQPDGRTITGSYECHPPNRPVTFGCFIAAVQCGGMTTTATPNPMPLESGRSFSCVATAVARRWPCQFRFTGYDPSSGRFTGEVTWLNLGSVHRVDGTWSGGHLTFTETQAMRRGGAHLNVTYDMRSSGTLVSGTWSDPSDRSSGTMTIDLAH